MEFNESHAIYLQIADLVCEKVILDNWKGGDRIPSVRDLAVELEVNPNTIMRTYEYLQQMEIINNKRGIGFFVASEGKEKAKNHKREIYFKQELPQLFKNMVLLDIQLDELENHFLDYLKNNKQLKDKYKNNKADNENKL